MQVERRSHWERAFETASDDELSWFQARAEPSLDLIRRHASSCQARIVDIGAGTSRLVDELLENDYSNITLVDISQASLDRTARRLGERASGIRFICADITDWEPHIVADIWHDRALFHFLIDKSDQDAYLAALETATIAGSKVIIATFAPDGPERCSGLPVKRYSAEQLESLFGAGFAKCESLRHIHITPAGREQPFTFAVFRRV